MPPSRKIIHLHSSATLNRITYQDRNLRNLGNSIQDLYMSLLSQSPQESLRNLYLLVLLHKGCWTDMSTRRDSMEICMRIYHKGSDLLRSLLQDNSTVRECHRAGRVRGGEARALVYFRRFPSFVLRRIPVCSTSASNCYCYFP